MSGGREGRGKWRGIYCVLCEGPIYIFFGVGYEGGYFQQANTTYKAILATNITVHNDKKTYSGIINMLFCISKLEMLYSRK